MPDRTLYRCIPNSIISEYVTDYSLTCLESDRDRGSIDYASHRSR